MIDNDEIAFSFPFQNHLRGDNIMPKVLQELELLCDADKRKSTNELPFISAHMLHDLYLRWNPKHELKQETA